MGRVALCFLAATFITLTGPSGRLAAAEGMEDWSVDDLVLAEETREFEVSPDGRFVVWVRSTVEKVEEEEKTVANLWLTRTEAAASIQLTRGTDEVSAPAFSPDGMRIAFLSTRELPGPKQEGAGKTQIWMLSLEGGESWPVTRLDRDVKSFGWRDNQSLILIAPESPSLWERERKEQKDTSIAVEDAEHAPPLRLFLATLGQEKVRRLTRNADWIENLAVSPDGRNVVFTAQRSLSYEYDQRVPPRAALFDLETLSERPLFADGRLLPSRIQWAPDGSGFYFIDEFTHDPRYRSATVSQLHFYSLAGGQEAEIDLGTDRGVGGGYAPTREGCVALLCDGVRYRPARFVRAGAGWKRADLQGAHAANLDRLRVSRDGCLLVYQYSSTVILPQLYLARLDGARILSPRRITDLNPGLEHKPAGRAEVERWIGALDQEVEGILYYPFDWKEGERRPLVVNIHGGPTDTDRDSWSAYWMAPLPLWRGKGAFVLQANYHGSVGYGLAWTESIGGGKYYELEIPDIEKGVDALIARGLVDPERLATAGWSNGGILSAELITRTHRYRCASIGAADVEWFSDWGNVDFGASFDNYYFGASPLENPALYMEKSPFFRLPSVTTPTIVFTGTEDRNVPPDQSWSLFRGLQQSTGTGVRLVLFPGEPHALREIAHQRRKLEEEQAWFERYFFHTTAGDTAAIKQGSLMAALLECGRAANSKNQVGLEQTGALIPETATFLDLQVGRFEVTRAQFAAFDPARPPAPGEDDLPVTGVSFAQATAYAAWLASRTAQPFRLPTQDEALRLAKAAGTGGNTLDHWAGYAPNPEDAARLLRQTDGLGRPGALLLPVGSLPGAGHPQIFDLDGNAAELAVDAAGNGVAVGPSADRAAAAVEEGQASSAYTGFRVVRDR